MSMLSEQRRKTKWIINPTKKPLWSSDSSGIKFGKQLMEKMGWSAGKGLGINEQGMQEPLKVSFKNDTKGMGFKGNDDDWIEHQDEFNILLNQLRNNGDSSVVKGTDVGKNEIKSLEEKSKQSKARVHYQKFTRGKDLSKYSENDLACILGTGKTKKKEKSKTEEVIETKTEMNGNCETSFGVTTINSGSIHDYFKKKWTGDKCKQNDSTNDEENFRPSFSTGSIDFSINDESCLSPYKEELKYAKKKHKSKTEKEQFDAEENIMLKSDDTNAESTEKVRKKKRKKTDEESHLEEPEEKKKKRNSNDLADIINDCPLKETYLSPENENSFKEKTKKDKKQKIKIPSEVESKKRKKDKKNKLEENNIDSVPKSEEMNSAINIEILLEESIKRKKKKDKKKEETKENECNNKNETLPLTENMDECTLERKRDKHKKKKKHKLEIFKGDNNNDASNNQDVVCNKLRSFSLEPIHTEEIIDVHQEGNVEKKKKKKNSKKEKTKEHDENGDEKYCLEVISGESNGKNEVENYLESGKKEKKENSKKKKRDGNEEIESENYHGKQIEKSSLSESSCEKINSSYEENDKCGSVKKKKKKREKLAVENKACLEEEQIEKESILELESVKKKSKKKHKKEKTENGNEECCQSNKSGELSVGVNSEKIYNIVKIQDNEINKEIVKKQDNEAINKEVEKSGVFSTGAQGEDRLLKLRANLFPDKAADKYFPERSANERVLKLVRWANIAQFKGSNLSDLEGYGRRMLYNKQLR